MRLQRITLAPSTAVSASAALLAWIPIAIGIVLGTLSRAIVLLFGGGFGWALAGSIGCALFGATIALLWLTGFGIGTWPKAVALSLFWAVLSIGFRALWLGLLLGGGWAGVLLDYRIWEGQPGIIIVTLVALGPIFLEWRAREAARTGSHPA